MYLKLLEFINCTRQKVAQWWCSVSSGKEIDCYFNSLDYSMQEIIDKCNNIEKKLDADIKALTEEVSMYKGMLHAVAKAIPDMMWCKGLDGKYIYANDAIKQGLLFSNNPIDKTDIELAANAKRIFGDANHTFGAKCLNSDIIVIEKVLAGTFQKDDGRFLESGMIKGKMVYLEVFKAPYYINDEFKGVAGTGRDITEYVEAYRKNNCRSCEGNADISDIFKKYEYEYEG